MKPWLIVALSLAFFSCHPSHARKKNLESPAPAESVASAATITASPDPVAAGGKLGETTISWNTGNDESGEVYVSKDGGAEKRFVAGPSGAEKAEWIQVGRRYEFRLYEGSAHSKILAKVQVTRHP